MKKVVYPGESIFLQYLQPKIDENIIQKLKKNKKRKKPHINEQETKDKI